MVRTNPRLIGSTAVVDKTFDPHWCRMKCSAPSTICNRGTKTFRYIRSMDSTSSSTCSFKTSATVRGNLDPDSACGVPLRPGDRLTVVPFMAVIYHRHFMHASGVLSYRRALVNPINTNETLPQTDKAASSISNEPAACFVGLRRSLVSVLS